MRGMYLKKKYVSDVKWKCFALSLHFIGTKGVLDFLGKFKGIVHVKDFWVVECWVFTSMINRQILSST